MLPACLPACLAQSTFLDDSAGPLRWCGTINSAIQLSSWWMCNIHAGVRAGGSDSVMRSVALLSEFRQRATLVIEDESGMSLVETIT